LGKLKQRHPNLDKGVNLLGKGEQLYLNFSKLKQLLSNLNETRTVQFPFEKN